VTTTRPARPADRDAVCALLDAQMREHAIDRPVADIARVLDTALAEPARAEVLVAEVAGRVVGVAYVAYSWTVERGGTAAWLEELYVAADQRGAGAGGLLLDAVIAAARARGCTALDLEVDVDHQRAANLYARRGFRTIPRAHHVLPL
jgi:GNAT superfamily N-acetyltransferase